MHHSFVRLLLLDYCLRDGVEVAAWVVVAVVDVCVVVAVVVVEADAMKWSRQGRGQGRGSHSRLVVKRTRLER